MTFFPYIFPNFEKKTYHSVTNGNSIQEEYTGNIVIDWIWVDHFKDCILKLSVLYIILGIMEQQNLANSENILEDSAGNVVATFNLFSLYYYPIYIW